MQARRFAKERLAALAAGLPSASGARKVALIVGNGAYKNVQKLDNPPRDAKLIADTFRGLAFQTVTLAPDLTRDKFCAALREFGSQAQKADWAGENYAGRGMESAAISYLF